jgi:hypothetical protein
MPPMRTLAALLLCGLTACTVSDPLSAPASSGSTPSAGEAPHPHGAWLRWRQRVGAHGEVPADTLYREVLAHQSRLAAQPESAVPTNWTLLGPGNIGGRVRSILIDPTNPQRMWAGSVGGGLWRSTNAGASWTMAPDLPSVLAITCLIQHPQQPDTIWAGTGEGAFFNQAEGSSNSAVQQGAGVFQSVDGGDTWVQVSGTSGAPWISVARLAIDRTNPQNLLAATISGIWRSSDGGSTWSQRTMQKTLDVKFDPNDTTKCVAGRTDGIAQYSTNGGVSWSNAPAFASTTRIELAYARSAPGVVYAATSTSNQLRVWRSANGGQTYVQQTAGGVVSILSNYSGGIWVDPTNAARLVIGGLDAYRSTNSGASWTKISAWASYPNSAHADQHMMLEHPAFDGVTNNTVYFANDGGVQRATNVFTVSNTSGWTNLAVGLAITQFYGCAISPISSVVMGGAQDNGTSRGTTISGLNGWTQPGGGDGGFCAADPLDPNYFYFQTQHLGLRRSSNGGTSSTGIATGISEPTSNFASYILLDPNDSNRLYAAGARLWRTNSAKGATPLSWVSVKAQIACADTPSPRPDHYEDNPPCNISTFAVARGNSNVMWVGHNNGELYRTSNALAATPTWTRVDTGAPGLPDRWLSRIAIDHFDHDVVTVSFLGFTPDNVWRTTDGGATWSPRIGTSSAALPAVPVSCIVQHRVLRERYYAATDLGLYYSEDDAQTWSPVPGGPTIVSIDELVWKNDRTLVVATHGRSLWTCDIDPASATSVGSGCGLLGTPDLVATAPLLGTNQSYTLTDAAPSAPVSLLIAGGPASPLALGACVLQVALPFLTVPIGSTSPGGGLVTAIAIPNGPEMVGVRLTAQALIAAAGGPLLGIAELSNGVEMALGF